MDDVYYRMYARYVKSTYPCLREKNLVSHLSMYPNYANHIFMNVHLYGRIKKNRFLK